MSCSLHQAAHGRHFHLEQPQGSEMIRQPEIEDVALGTLPATFDQCQVGKLKLSKADKYFRKRTTVFTTSRMLHHTLHGQLCNKQHEHQAIAGTFRRQPEHRQNISAYAAAYTAQFARMVSQILIQKWRILEDRRVLEELLAGFEENPGQKRQISPRDMATGALELKRRRCTGKQETPAAFKRDFQGEDGESSRKKARIGEEVWEDVFRVLSRQTPRVGNLEIRTGEMFDKLKQTVPEMNLVLVLACRGVDRSRLPPRKEDWKSMPLRKLVYMHRQTGQIVDHGPVENWYQLNNSTQRIRKAGPAKLALTMFGAERTAISSVVPEGPAPEENASAPSRPHGNEHAPEVDGPERGWPPKNVVSGPSFCSLSSQQKEQIRRIHNNLGHPDPHMFGKFLKERGANPEVVQGALQYQCSTCAETGSKTIGKARNNPPRPGFQ